jgi:phage tail sheath protein FI
MSTNPTTPGVYIREISTIPPSVAPVSTAVPGFAGYTEKGPLNTPTRISSMLEFEQIF